MFWTRQATSRRSHKRIATGAGAELSAQFNELPEPRKRSSAKIGTIQRGMRIHHIQFVHPSNFQQTKKLVWLLPDFMNRAKKCGDGEKKNENAGISNGLFIVTRLIYPNCATMEQSICYFRWKEDTCPRTWKQFPKTKPARFSFIKMSTLLILVWNGLDFFYIEKKNTCILNQIFWEESPNCFEFGIVLRPMVWNKYRVQ